MFQNVIPLLKDNLENECTSEMIQMIGERILSLVTDQEKGQVSTRMCVRVGVNWK